MIWGELVKLVQEQELLYSIYLLYWYKSANTDAEARADSSLEASGATQRAQRAAHAAAPHAGRQLRRHLLA